MRLIYLPVLLLILLQGCGHKGPLYLPASDPVAAPATPATPQPASEEKKP